MDVCWFSLEFFKNEYFPLRWWYCCDNRKLKTTTLQTFSHMLGQYTGLHEIAKNPQICLTSHEAFWKIALVCSFCSSAHIKYWLFVRMSLKWAIWTYSINQTFTKVGWIQLDQANLVTEHIIKKGHFLDFQKFTAGKQKDVDRPRPDKSSSGRPLYIPTGRSRLEPGKSSQLIMGPPIIKKGHFLDFQKFTAGK